MGGLLVVAALLTTALAAEAGLTGGQQRAAAAYNFNQGRATDVATPEDSSAAVADTAIPSEQPLYPQAAQQPPQPPEASGAIQQTQQRLSQPRYQQPNAVPDATSSVPPGGSNFEYTLGAGDKLRVTVFGEPDLSGEFEVDSTGRLSMPLVGEVQATNKSIREVGKAIEAMLSQGYLKDPKVSIDVMNYRPFFILGEVMKPGSYPYVNGMTVVNAVALAGGYTYRAQKGEITIVRAGDNNKTEQRIEEIGEVLPGDVVRVPERFF